MSPTRLAEEPTGRSRGDHILWPLHGHDDLRATARPYVAEGLDANERVAYLGHGDPGTLKADLDGIPALDDLVATGRIQLFDIDSMPASDPTADPAEELQLLEAMTRDALADGYAGLRMVSELTNRVRDEHARAAYVRYEHLIDRFALENPFTALCAYDVDELGDDAVAEVAHVHRLLHDELAPFQLRAHAAADLALVGSVDAFSAEGLARALQQIGVPEPGGEATIDATGVEFLDHRALLALERHASANDARVVLRSPRPITGTLAAVLRLHSVRVDLVR